MRSAGTWPESALKVGSSLSDVHDADDVARQNIRPNRVYGAVVSGILQLVEVVRAGGQEGDSYAVAQVTREGIEVGGLGSNLGSRADTHQAGEGLCDVSYCF